MMETLEVRRKIPHVGSLRKVMLIHRDVKFNEFESQIRRASECETSPIKIMYLFKYEAMSVWIDVLAQEDLSAILYLHNIYNVGKISIYVIKTHSETLSPAIVETQDHYASNMNERFMDLEAGDLAEILRKTVRTSNQLPTS